MNNKTKVLLVIIGCVGLLGLFSVSTNFSDVDAIVANYRTTMDGSYYRQLLGQWSKAEQVIQPSKSQEDSDTKASLPLNGELVYGPGGMHIPLYLQHGNQPWSDTRFGNGTVAQKGCGPTSMAMILTYMTDETITPSDLIAWCGPTKYYLSGVGVTHSLFSDAASHWGFKCTALGKNTNAMVAALGRGEPVIVSVKAGLFTTGGHIMVLRGLTEDGKILVNNPSDTKAKGHLNMSFTKEVIARESKAYWSFQKGK